MTFGDEKQRKFDNLTHLLDSHIGFHVIDGVDSHTGNDGTDERSRWAGWTAHWRRWRMLDGQSRAVAFHMEGYDAIVVHLANLFLAMPHAAIHTIRKAITNFPASQSLLKFGRDFIREQVHGWNQQIHVYIRQEYYYTFSTCIHMVQTVQSQVTQCKLTHNDHSTRPSSLCDMGKLSVSFSGLISLTLQYKLVKNHLLCYKSTLRRYVCY